MKYFILMFIFLSTQANAQFFLFKKRQAPIPIPPKEISFNQSHLLKVPVCAHLDKISCIMDNAQRFYPDKSEEQIVDIQTKMIIQTYNYLNDTKTIHLTESQVLDAFVQGKMFYEFLKQKDIEIQPVEKWQRYFVGEVVVSAMNSRYAINSGR